MDKELLFHGEQIIMQSDDQTVVFTNLRMRYNYSRFGRADIISIMLEKISSIAIHYRSLTILLTLAGIVFMAGVVVGVVLHELIFVLSGFGLGALLYVLYLLSRKHYIRICSDGGTSLYFYTSGMKSEQVLDFVNKLEETIKARRENLK